MLEIQCEQLVGQNRMKDFFRSSESMLAAPVCVCVQLTLKLSLHHIKTPMFTF